jgi:hypothetical protein
VETAHRQGNLIERGPQDIRPKRWAHHISTLVVVVSVEVDVGDCDLHGGDHEGLNIPLSAVKMPAQSKQLKEQPQQMTSTGTVRALGEALRRRTA